MKTKDSLKVWKYTSKNLKICSTYSKSTRYIVNEPKFADTLLWFINFLFQDIPNMKTSRHMLEFCWESMGGFHIFCSLFQQESSFFDTAIANLRTLSNNYDVIFKAPTPLWFCHLYSNHLGDVPIFTHGAGGEIWCKCGSQATICMNYYITYPALAFISYWMCLGVIRHLYSVCVFMFSVLLKPSAS